jgi:medium-chain acyl-[acyl-carrier-protein] hydrolase
VASPWIVRFKPRPAAALRMFCFSYAGGSAHAFGQWAQSIPSQVEVVGIQLPGRGARMFEPAFTSLPTLVHDVSVAMLPYLNKPFVLFGHSMGTLISFELARYLRARGIPKPLHLFVSGSGSPRHRDRTRLRSTMSDDELIEELISLNGNATEVLTDTELMRIMLPTIRADFKVCETYVYRPSTPLEFPVTAFGGVEDVEVPEERLQLWEEETSARFSLHMFPGSHFYLHTARVLLLEALTKELAPYVQAVGV